MPWTIPLIVIFSAADYIVAIAAPGPILRSKLSWKVEAQLSVATYLFESRRGTTGAALEAALH